jgi:hypothetical protein
VHLRDGGGGDRLAELGEQHVEGTAQGDLDHAHGLGARERRHAVLQALEVARDDNADDVRTRGEELAELDIGRPEPRQGGRQPRGAGPRTPSLDHAGEAQQQPRDRRQDIRIDQRERALPRQHEAGAEVAREVDDVADHVRSSRPNAARRCHRSWSCA